MIYYISLRRTDDHHAGAKAPNDIYSLCEQSGWIKLSYPCPKKNHSLLFFRLQRGALVLLFWISALLHLKPGDVVFFQHPVRYGSKIACRFIRILQREKVRFVVLIHDLDSLRYGMIYTEAAHTKVNYEDDVFLRQFDAVICHNEKMKAYLVGKGFCEQKLICLHMFDYLVNSPIQEPRCSTDGIVIAGNLDPQKCSYVYRLIQLDLGVPIHLYGVNYEETITENRAVEYHGSIAPDLLPSMMKGSFGIVWDGDDIDSCTGVGGNYLRFNNPHKLSLYMAAGIPVITWREAAIASFVEENGIGITLASLRELPARLNRISEAEYMKMTEKVKKIKEIAVQGGYFKQAFNQAMELCENADGGQRE